MTAYPEPEATAAKLRLYETVLDATPDLVYVFDLQHRFIYANQALLTMWGCSWDAARGKTCLELGYEPWHAAMHDEEIERVIATHAPIRGDVPFPHTTLGTRIYDYIFMPVLGPDGEVEAIAGTTRDVTERKEHEEASRQSEQRFSAMVNASADLIYRMSPDWERAEIVGGHSASEHPQMQANWMEFVHPDDRRRVLDAIRQACETRTPFQVEHRARRGEERWAWISSRAVPIEQDDGSITEWFGAATDITERMQHEEHMKLLVNELNHRVKNTLTVVHSMIRQTLRGCTDTGQALERIESRLLALSEAHDTLTRTHWEGASVNAIVCAAIAHCVDEAGRRFHLEGPGVQIDPRRAVALSMALHELCTNAVKYGALSSHDGHVDVRWDLRRQDGQSMLHLCWKEVGGPSVAEPPRRGFGSRLIERGLKHDLGGQVELRFEPAGVQFHLVAPLPETLLGNSP